MNQRNFLNEELNKLEFIKDWYEQHPGGMNPYDDPPERDTLRVEKVRTKSEQILDMNMVNRKIQEYLL